MLSVLFGLIAVAFGIWGLLNWTPEFLGFLKGCFPISILFAGLIAICMGYSRRPRTPPGSKKGS